MAAAGPFGLYPTRERVAGQRVSAGAVFNLDSPVVDGGATLFRQSLWLAVPVSARGATALQLAASSLALRFEPLTLDVATDDLPWFDAVHTEADNQTVRLELAWPASVIRLPDPSATQHAIGFDLYRADRDRRADEPTMSGHTGATLSPPWVGSPMVVVMNQPVLPVLQVEAVEIVVMLASAGPAAAGAGAAAAAAPQGAGQVQVAPPGAKQAEQAAAAFKRQRSHVVPTLTLRGVPTSPRAKLFMEARGGAPETLLWQTLLPGEQGTVTLPEKSVTDEWAPALEQVRKRLAAEAPAVDAPLLLRLDVESDAPARLTLTQATLALDGSFEALAGETRLDFDGTSSQAQSLALSLPAGGALQGLTLSGRVDGGRAADAGAAALPADLRRGLLLADSVRVQVHTVLAAPARVGGLAIAWHPLSDAVALTLRLLADAGDAPSAVPLQTLKLRADTPAPGWLALRGAALDLQAQHLWLELTVDEGSGLWLADACAPPPRQGQIEQREARPPQRQPLGLQPALAWLPADAPAAPEQPRRVGLFSADQPLAAQLDA
jgi:hypothetical protein